MIFRILRFISGWHFNFNFFDYFFFFGENGFSNFWLTRVRLQLKLNFNLKCVGNRLWGGRRW